MKKLKKWFADHPCAYRAMRTFVQSAAGVLTAAVISAAGVVKDMDVSAVIALAVATGLAAVMNRGSAGEKEDTKDDGSDENGV